VSVPDIDRLVSALQHAADEGLDSFVLGGGSNLLVADTGYDGLVVQLANTGIEEVPSEPGLVRAGAGASWDRLVAWSVARGWAGVECLSGIPGRVGAAPIQNIGAYGQEVSETVERVHLVDRSTYERRILPGSECGFGYRKSHFKNAWAGRFVVTAVDLRLRPGGAATLRYPSVQKAVGEAKPTLKRVRDVVLSIRAEKSMVLDPSDPNCRSAGSFFMNPILPFVQLKSVREGVAALGIDPSTIPSYEAGPDQRKLSAAWLIERAGFPRGHRDGAAGLSTRHTLALINRGDATASDLLRLAARIRARVQDCFGVTLWPEPVLLGFDAPVETILDEARCQS
jgi:UDP-N-acetylmuramate dehydrogenase